MSYYLIQIKGEMISGRLITKTPPTQGFMQTISNAGKPKNQQGLKDKGGEVITITPLTWTDILAGAYPVPEGMISEEQIIRKYLDNLKD